MLTRGALLAGIGPVMLRVQWANSYFENTMKKNPADFAHEV